jgi:hypothetical protein
MTSAVRRITNFSDILASCSDRFVPNSRVARLAFGSLDLTMTDSNTEVNDWSVLRVRMREEQQNEDEPLLKIGYVSKHPGFTKSAWKIHLSKSRAKANHEEVVRTNHCMKLRKIILHEPESCG